MRFHLAVTTAIAQIIVSNAFDCSLPENADKYSVITSDDATIGAHSMYKGLAIGGTLFDGVPNESATVDRYRSYVNVLDSNNRFNFNAGINEGETVGQSMIEQFEYLASHAQSSNIGGKKVVVVTSGGTYNMYDFNNGGQGEDNGNTVIIFNTSQDIFITKTSDGRQFGPSIIAPFAKVSVRGDAGYVDGFVMAKEFETIGGNQGSLQLHGDTYTGQFQCGAASNTVTEVDTTADVDNTVTAVDTTANADQCVVEWGSCHGAPETCCDGLHCEEHQYYSQCKTAPAAPVCAAEWQACTGAMDSCCDDLVCIGNEYYAQCKTAPPPTPAPIDQSSTITSVEPMDFNNDSGADNSEPSAECGLPVDADKYSVITSEDATIGAHSMYKGLAIGGTLFDGAPNESATVDRYRSYVNVLDSNNRFNFNAGINEGQTVSQSMISQFEYLASHAESSYIGGKKVVVVTSGGTYNMYDFNNGGQGEDNGNTVIIFNTSEDIFITKTPDGRQFGPSIIAPFAKVSVLGDAGYVDGFVMAKQFETIGGNQGSLQLHGDTYTGQFQCVPGVDVPTDPPVPSPTDAPVASPTDAPVPSPTDAPVPSPTDAPVPSPTDAPVPSPTDAPVPSPTDAPVPSPTDAPVPSPTDAPVPSPTDAPVPSPTDAPVPSPTEPPVSTSTRSADRGTNSGGGGGDPHFKTWTGHKFDYHGECDLVLLHSPSFANAMGLRVHVRTTRVNYYSYMERIAVQIGADALEFANDLDEWWLNGQPVSDGTLAGYEIRKFRKANAISIRLNDETKSKIDLFGRRNGMPYIVVDGGNNQDLFQGGLGMIGDWESGKMIGRDGVTELTDATEFALEWQVRDTEPMLFQNARAPQFPETCTPPKKTLGNRLGDSHMKKKAEEVCEAWKEDKDDCIFDVMATRDIVGAFETPSKII